MVTGAAKRIGKAIAIDLARNGFRVAVHYNGSRQSAETVRDEIRRSGGEAAIFQCDLSDPVAVRNLIPGVREVMGTLDVLVNNASQFASDGPGSFDDAIWDAHMNLHVRAPVYLADAYAAQLPDDRKGVIINMIDQRVWRLNPTFISYTLSKSALWTATQTLALAFAPRIRVCGIGPGPTLANSRQDASDFEAQSSNTPLGHGPSLNEICNTVRFIIDTPSLTGQMIAVDGGQHMAWETPDVLNVRE